MASTIGEAKSPYKRTQVASKVKFDLDDSQPIDDIDESLEEISEVSSLDSTMNGSTLHVKTSSSSSNKRYLRYQCL